MAIIARVTNMNTIQGKSQFMPFALCSFDPNCIRNRDSKQELEYLVRVFS
jgi:hypothetical protein